MRDRSNLGCRLANSGQTTASDGQRGEKQQRMKGGNTRKHQRQGTPSNPRNYTTDQALPQRMAETP